MHLRGETSSPPPHTRLINQLLKPERLFLQCDPHLVCYGCSQFLWEHIRFLPFFQTRRLLFTLFLSPQNCSTGLGRSHIFWIFPPHFLRQHQGSLLLSSYVPSFRISVFSSQDDSECLGIPKECVVGRTMQTVPSPSLRYGPGLVPDSSPALSSSPGPGLPCLGQIRGLSAANSKGGMVSGVTGPLRCVPAGSSCPYPSPQPGTFPLLR